jgi:hypothetical protein
MQRIGDAEEAVMNDAGSIVKNALALVNYGVRHRSFF